MKLSAVQCTPDRDSMEVEQENVKPATKKVFLDRQQHDLAIQGVDQAFPEQHTCHMPLEHLNTCRLAARRLCCSPAAQ